MLALDVIAGFLNFCVRRTAAPIIFIFVFNIFILEGAEGSAFALHSSKA